MKKKIAFIDYFIDEWHANNYPKWFKEAPLGDEFEIAYAWEDHQMEGRRDLQQWCKDFGVTPVASIAEAVEKADCLCVLAPSTPEVHEQLAELPLASGKPLYIDKPFAPSKEVAIRIFEKAAAHGTPLMSSSALRYGDQLIDGKLKAAKPAIMTTTGGGRSYHEYAIHQLEMIISVMGTDYRKISCFGDANTCSAVIEFEGGRIAQLAYNPWYAFSVTAAGKDLNANFPSMDNTFQNLIADILKFFKTGVSPIDKNETITIADILEQTVATIEK